MLVVMLLCVCLSFSMTSCGEDDEPADDVDPLISQLQETLTTKTNETQSLIEHLKTEYNTKILALEESINGLLVVDNVILNSADLLKESVLGT